MKGITAGISTVCLFFALLTNAAASPVPYKDGGARHLGGAPMAKLPLHPVAPITAVFGATGRGFPSGHISFSFDYLFSQTDKLRFHDYHVGKVKQLTTNLGLAKLRYGIFPGLDIRSETPFYLISTEDFTGNNKTYHFMGDTTVVVHKVVVSQIRDIGEFDFAVDIGVTLPTAEVSDDSLDFFGTGNWGMLAGMQASWLYGRHRVDSELNFASFMEGKHSYRKPDRVRLNLGWGYVLGPALDLGVESCYEWNGNSERHGKKEYDSFTSWFIGPKLAYRLPQYRMLLGTALTFPAYRHYEKPTMAEDYRIELTFAKFF